MEFGFKKYSGTTWRDEDYIRLATGNICGITNYAVIAIDA